MRNSGCCVGEVRMEVPLAWQDPVPLASFPIMEADSEDIPPSPTPDTVTPPLFGAGTFFQQGFLDCAQEALRFLTEEEGMSENNPVVMGLQQHLVKATPYSTPPTSSQCLSSSSFSQSQRGRFTPYTVPSRCCRFPARRGADKCCSSMSLRGGLHEPRCSINAAPSTSKIEHVLNNDVISLCDLQGVLACLESGQSKHPQTYSSLSHSDPTPSSLAVLKNMSTESDSCNESKKNDSDLDDSGISEATIEELIDDVDGVDNQGTSVGDVVCDVDSAACTDSVSVRVRDSSVSHDSEETVKEPIYESLPLETSNLSPLNTSCHSPPSSVALLHSVSSSVVSTPAAADTVDSNPSSQLALLSSLSSGTHRLTSADNGDLTASRIQSLASQILLLLQEEADAQEYSDEESDDEEQTSDIGESDTELEEDSLPLEAEP